MNRIQKIRIVIDCGMAVLLPLLMAYSLVGEAVHEWLGTAMAALSILHHILNRKWYRGLFKERHTGIRVLTVATDLLLLANMIALPVSGIMMSRHVFASLGIKAGLSFARTIHLLFSYWGLVLMSFHMGLHGAMIMGMFRRMVSIKSKSAARTIILEGKMPAVIISHELGATLDRVNGYAEALAEAGYVTCCFDFCGGGMGSRSDGDLLDMSVLTEKADLEAVLEEVQEWEFVDADAIYLMGNSQGGLVTAMTAAEHQDEIQAVILIYPAFSLYDNVHEMFDSPEDIPETHRLLGLRLGRRYFVDIWDQEPYEIIQQYGKNILLIHGDRDSIVPIAYSDRLAETVEHVEYHVLQGADHGYLGDNFDLAVTYIKNFLENNKRT